MACLACSFSIFRDVNEWQVTGKWVGVYAAFTVLLSKPVKVPSAKTRAMRLDVRKRMP